MRINRMERTNRTNRTNRITKTIENDKNREIEINKEKRRYEDNGRNGNNDNRMDELHGFNEFNGVNGVIGVIGKRICEERKNEVEPQREGEGDEEQINAWEFDINQQNQPSSSLFLKFNVNKHDPINLLPNIKINPPPLFPAQSNPFFYNQINPPLEHFQFI